MKPSFFPGHYDTNRKFHYHRRNQNLIRRNNGKILQYKDLPRECQLALAQYMSIDGEAWDAPQTVYDAYRKAHQHAYDKDKTRYHELMEQANNLVTYGPSSSQASTTKPSKMAGLASTSTPNVAKNIVPPSGFRQTAKHCSTPKTMSRQPTTFLNCTNNTHTKGNNVTWRKRRKQCST